jgi:hypothetical protein
MVVAWASEVPEWEIFRFPPARSTFLDCSYCVEKVSRRLLQVLISMLSFIVFKTSLDCHRTSVCPHHVLYTNHFHVPDLSLHWAGYMALDRLHLLLASGPSTHYRRRATRNRSLDSPIRSRPGGDDWHHDMFRCLGIINSAFALLAGLCLFGIPSTGADGGDVTIDILALAVLGWG